VASPWNATIAYPRIYRAGIKVSRPGIMLFRRKGLDPADHLAPLVRWTDPILARVPHSFTHVPLTVRRTHHLATLRITVSLPRWVDAAGG